MKCTFLADWLACELLHIGRGNYPQKITLLSVNDDDHEHTCIKSFMTKHFFKK